MTHLHYGYSLELNGFRSQVRRYRLMAISTSSTTGWSDLLSYEISSGNPYDDDSYNSLSATWFMRSWWDSRRWARKWDNIYDIPVRITSMNFLACAGHSNSRTFGASSTGGLTGPSNGYGCTFTVDVYVVGSSKNESLSAASSTTLESISSYNCYYGGYGNVSTSDDQTSFGSVTFFGPGTGYSTDSSGNRRYRYSQVFEFTDAPAVPAGGCMYVHVRPTDWPSGSTSTNSMLVIQSRDPFFDATLEPAENPYIWRFDGTAWVKDRYCYQFTGSDWNKLSEE